LHPNSARIDDCLLGGKDNHETDRAVAEQVPELATDTRSLAWFSRQFLVPSDVRRRERAV
jgi:hypothetical protein